MIFFLNGWHRVSTPAIPAAGATIDVEAREAIGALIETLRDAGIFPAL